MSMSAETQEFIFGIHKRTGVVHIERCVLQVVLIGI